MSFLFCQDFGASQSLCFVGLHEFPKVPLVWRWNPMDLSLSESIFHLNSLIVHLQSSSYLKIFAYPHYFSGCLLPSAILHIAWENPGYKKSLGNAFHHDPRNHKHSKKRQPLIFKIYPGFLPVKIENITSSAKRLIERNINSDS